MITDDVEAEVVEHGFAELSIDEGMTSGANYTAGCSGARSDCCTRTCSQDAVFAGSNEAWESFLFLEGGEIQY